MSIFRRPKGTSWPRLANEISLSLFFLAALFVTWPQHLSAGQDAQSAQAARYTQQTPEQMQQLVAPIAVYPDSLVAHILAASTFREQVVEADRRIQAHPDLEGENLAQSVDQQSWDSSV